MSDEMMEREVAGLLVWVWCWTLDYLQVRGIKLFLPYFWFWLFFGIWVFGMVVLFCHCESFKVHLYHMFFFFWFKVLQTGQSWSPTAVLQQMKVFRFAIYFFWLIISSFLWFLQYLNQCLLSFLLFLYTLQSKTERDRGKKKQQPWRSGCVQSATYH